MGISYLMSRCQLTSFNPEGWLYQQRNWERNGRIYEGFFRLKSWKQKLPDGAAIFKGGFTKKHLKENSREYLREFIMETCRAELTHWIVFLFGFVFFIWNIWWVGIVMIIYAAIVNIPCIITQRYNRIRLRKITD
ncbi:glycosyl-4,4'-diaponeurosporenoate acyltransferase [Chloroflexota bacterium]